MLVARINKPPDMRAKISEPVKVRQIISAPPALVFDAWVNPQLIRKWLFVGPTSEIVNVNVDLRIQGKFSILELEKSTNEYIDHFGKYIEINRPGRLAFALSVPKHFPGETNVLIEIVTIKEGSELKLTQIGVPKDVTKDSWEKMFNHLKRTLENR